MQAEQGQAAQEHAATERQAYADCKAQAAAEKELAKTTPVATKALAAPPQSTLPDPARVHGAWGGSGPLLLGTLPVPPARALAPVQLCLAPAAGSAPGCAEPSTPKHDPQHADGSDDSDAVHYTRLRSDYEADRTDCRHDTLEVLAVESEHHLCARCKKSWTASSTSVMSCTDCYGLLCNSCHERLVQNASRRATKKARRQMRESRGGREASPHHFR